MMIESILQTGAANAISGKDLCRILNINMRELTLSIAKERQQGAPICASSDLKRPGYYLAADKGEMQRYCNSLHHRAGEIHRARNACLKAMEKLPESEDSNE